MRDRAARMTLMKVFVYGTLKRSYCRAHALRGQRFVGEARTAARYRMYDTGSYPALVEDDEGVSIEGEVWEVDADCLRRLDVIEGVPVLYQRKPIAIEHPPAERVEAYIYRQSVAGLADCGSRWGDAGGA